MSASVVPSRTSTGSAAGPSASSATNLGYVRGDGSACTSKGGPHDVFHGAGKMSVNVVLPTTIGSLAGPVPKIGSPNTGVVGQHMSGVHGVSHRVTTSKSFRPARSSAVISPGGTRGVTFGPPKVHSNTNEATMLTTPNRTGSHSANESTHQNGIGLTHDACNICIPNSCKNLDHVQLTTLDPGSNKTPQINSIITVTPSVAAAVTTARATSEKMIPGHESKVAGSNKNVVKHVGTNEKKNTASLTVTVGVSVGPGVGSHHSLSALERNLSNLISSLVTGPNGTLAVSSVSLNFTGIAPLVSPTLYTLAGGLPSLIKHHFIETLDSTSGTTTHSRVPLTSPCGKTYVSSPKNVDKINANVELVLVNVKKEGKRHVVLD